MPTYDSVVRVYCTSQTPDYDTPWQTSAPESGTGSGVAVDSKRILTGAHVVANATFLQVQLVGTAEKRIVEVESICHDCDLALLRLVKGRFDLREYPKMGGMPKLRDKVSVVGFPVGGEEVSITEGVVSRIEVQRYSHSQRRLMAATVDAAINEGNSGGPVFRGDRIVGIAFQKLGGDVDNIGEMVPANMIKSFLKQAKKRRRVHVPHLGVWTQTLENPSLREHLGLKKKDGGVLVLHVDHGSSAHQTIEPGDVILSIGGTSIANNGTILFQKKHRTDFSAILSGKHVGESMKLKVFRNGKRVDESLTLRKASLLVARKEYEKEPSYFVWGGFVFQTLTRNFLETWEDWETQTPTTLIQAYRYGVRTSECRERVILSRIFAHTLTLGYEKLDQQMVKAINGAPIRDLPMLTKGLAAADGLTSIQLESGAVIVVDAQAVKQETPDILARYNITNVASDDLAPYCGGLGQVATKPSVSE